MKAGYAAVPLPFITFSGADTPFPLTQEIRAAIHTEKIPVFRQPVPGRTSLKNLPDILTAYGISSLWQGSFRYFTRSIHFYYFSFRYHKAYHIPIYYARKIFL